MTDYRNCDLYIGRRIAGLFKKWKVKENEFSFHSYCLEMLAFTIDFDYEPLLDEFDGLITEA